MRQKRLGLPLEYKKLPQYFDAWNINENTEKTNEIIAKLLKSHNVKAVLDLTCGTGSQVFYLAKQGFNVTGVDVSSPLLDIARKRALKEKYDVKFIDGDMRTLKVGYFDAVITIFNAVGHLTKLGFAKAIRNIYKNLKERGIYIFDILNRDSMTEETVANLAYYVHKKIGSTQILATQCSTFDKANGVLTSYNSYLIQKKADRPERFYNKFSLQIYTAEELKALLAENGFEVLAQSALDSAEFIKDKSLNILTVARKNK